MAGSVDELGLTGSAIGEEKRPGGRKVRMIAPPPTHTQLLITAVTHTMAVTRYFHPVQGGSGVLNMRGMLQDAIKEASAAIEGPEVSWERSAFFSGSRQ